MGISLRSLASLTLSRLRAESVDQMWITADAALLANDANTAHEIYRQLCRRKPRTPYEFLFVGLAAYRLKDVPLALDVLEAGHLRYRSMADLTDNFLRIAIEHEQLDRALRSIDALPGKVACERLIAQPLDWKTHVSLVVYLLRAGHWDFANARIDEIIRACDSTAENWRLSDILLKLRRKSDADRIYDKLASRAAKNADDALYAALSLERLQAPDKAAARLEAELAKYPHASYLREHFLRICTGSGQIGRLARLVEKEAGGPEALEPLFARFPAVDHQCQLIEFCIDNRHGSLARSKLSRHADEGGYDSGALWQISQYLDGKGYASEVGAIYRTLVDRPHKTSWEFYYAAAAALRLGEADVCLGLLEAGQSSSPTAPELRNFYLQMCAARLQHERYSTFLKKLGIENARGVDSVAEFYCAAVENLAPDTFILNFRELESTCSRDTFNEIKHTVLGALERTPLPRDKKRILAFFSRYLDLDDEFTADLWRVIGDRTNQGAAEHSARAKEQRFIEMLFRLTPPMIAAERGRSQRQIRQFIEACHSLALRPIELSEPIQDMSNNWTPWQYIFCSGEMHVYSSAVAALEKIAVKTWPKLGYVAPHVAERRQENAGKRVRIGFIVHDSMPMMSGLLRGLNPQVYETVFLRPGKRGRSRAAETWIERAERVVEYPDNDSYAAIDAIAAEQLDIIVSGPSVAAVFFPMMARLAPLQMVLLEPNWTDGLTNADYYISWKAAEPEDTARYYKSNVALLDHPPYFIERHPVQEVSDEAKRELRARLLDLGERDRIYLCANTPPKIHPRMDEMFGRLLQSDPDGRLVILRGEYPPSKTLKFRLHQKLGKLADRIVFLPTLKQEDAHSLLLTADACLDSFPLCGMSSSFDAAMLGVPIVTLPTPIPFGRWTATIYDYIGMTGLTAKDEDEYLQIALRLAKDPAWRKELGHELRQKAQRFVQSAASVEAFATFIAKSWERHKEGYPTADWIDGAWHAASTKVDSGLPNDSAVEACWVANSPQAFPRGTKAAISIDAQRARR